MSTTQITGRFTLQDNIQFPLFALFKESVSLAVGLANKKLREVIKLCEIPFREVPFNLLSIFIDQALIHLPNMCLKNEFELINEKRFYYFYYIIMIKVDRFYFCTS